MFYIRFGLQLLANYNFAAQIPDEFDEENGRYLSESNGDLEYEIRLDRYL